MTLSDDEDENLVHFLESECLVEVSDQEAAEEEDEEEEDERRPKRICLNERDKSKDRRKGKEKVEEKEKERYSKKPRSIESGIFTKIPPELFPHILKFLSSEDLMACSLVCKYLSYAASDESLWRRLYCMRWGLLPPSSKRLCDCAWKKLYIQRDEEDMVKLVRNCPAEFKEYYIQMNASKRSQAPLPSQVKDDQILLDKTVSDQVSIWKSSRGLTDKVFADHTCSGETCSYHQIGDVFVCEKTGNVHVCGDTCREVIISPLNELLVCTISGLCFDRLLSPCEMELDPIERAVADEAEPFMGSGRFARAYLLGYNCDDENELEAALRDAHSLVQFGI
ncbi:F-box protein SKIP31 isoform X2 [Euphorbia lathyris]|uniref:F-box protein SKIP31 isoform X2 n=1 Tax=Euphorbia lathyris TaxID=212925 RepID=UPI003313B34B